MEEQLITEMYGYLFLIAAIVGAVANKTNFCTMGAVSDWVNMGDKSRFYGWLLAIAVAILGGLLLQMVGDPSLDETRPVYRSANLVLGQYIVGGLLFGIGMTLGSGCGNKTMIRIGTGNLKSVIVVLMMGGTAYLMTTTDLGYQLTFGLLAPLSINLNQVGIESQEVSALLMHATAGEDISLYRLLTGVAAILAISWVIFRNREFRQNRELIFGSSTVGLAVVAAWFVTGGPLGQSVLEAVEFMDNPPRGMGVQSLTFGAPTGDLMGLIVTGLDRSMITIGLIAITGVAAGSFLYAITSGNFRIEWFASKADFINHLVGGTLMGLGAILGMGCTFGQGITGLSTLALGSALVMASILLGSALTMKVQYYQLVYEEEATFFKALLSGLADLRLIPDRYRRLDAI